MPTSDSEPQSELTLLEHSEDKEEEDGASSNGEYIDSPEVDDVPSHAETSHVETSHLDGTMEGELDFEDEVAEVEKPKSDCERISLEETKAEDDEPKSGDEEGQLSPDKKLQKVSGDDSVEEGEDEGEISDDDDLEEGEVKDNSTSPSTKPPTRQVCRFFNRGLCTWGNLCRFLHLSVNERGHYNMFAPTPRQPPSYGPPGTVNMGPAPPPAMMTQRARCPDFLPPLLPPLPPPQAEVAPVETAWERGLRHAKELMKKASRRKEQEPDFEDKRLNLSIDENPRTAEFDKENEFHGKVSYKRQSEVQPYKQYEDLNEFDNGDHEAKEHYRVGRYENFEVKKWTRQKDMQNKKDRREKERSRRGSSRVPSTERDKMPKQIRGKERWRDERFKFEVPSSRHRADEWRDPWQRSKSPRGARRSRSRGRSGSYSSVSSNSYSDRSSRTSGSYSRSSSRTSFCSSRRSTSSRSRSGSRTPSASRSRSYSRSISMDSVSSASSSVSHSSSGSNFGGTRNPHTSILRKEEEEKQLPFKGESKATSSTLFEEMQKLKQYDKMKETEKVETPEKQPPVSVPPQEPAMKPLDIHSLPSLQYLLPSGELPAKREALKYNTHKQPIKLTLLNKALPSKTSCFPKRELEVNKIKQSERDDVLKTGSANQTGVKRPLSPQPPLSGMKILNPAAPKRSTSSRRDELLKQLKAVEDAIARKRAKV